MKRHSRSGMSVIEMLTVVSIIMLILGLILPLSMTVKTQARKNRARREVAQIAGSWLSYQMDYRKFPTNGTDLSFMGPDAVAILRGNPPHSANPRCYHYMDFRGDTTEFLDPWGHAYRMALASDGGRVTVAGQELPVSVAVWSRGPDGVESGDDIRSWK